MHKLLFMHRIIAVLSPEERSLFKERIRSLDKKIHPGLTKLTWASKGISDYFIGECRNNCSKVSIASLIPVIIRNIVTLPSWSGRGVVHSPTGCGRVMVLTP